jgi:hypothetical protein
LKLSALLLAEHASARDNLLYVVAGGINRLTASDFPIPLAVSLCWLLTLEADDTDGPHTFRIELKRLGVDEVLAGVAGEIGATTREDATPGTPRLLVGAVNLSPMSVPSEGQYTLGLDVAGREGESVWFEARKAGDI